MISGVSAGLGHYFGIDAVWVRILFITSMGQGRSPCLYYSMVVVPAVTTSEKLETGEPVNISNIEKKGEEFENVSDKFKMLITINTGTK
jgi:phage shock protein PspC (stress-responsive transcriptional regulator)